MPLKKIVFKPGVNRENTRYTTEGGWYDCDKIRFRQGNPEKIGGWLRTSAYTFLGVCRSLWNWVTLDGLNLVGVGTNLKFYIARGWQYFDVTPLRTYDYSTTLTNPFDTTSASAIVTVNDTAHGAATGDLVYFSGATTVGGVPADELNTRHVITYVDANSYTITVTTVAGSTVTGGGGTVAASYVLKNWALGSNPFATTSGSATVVVTSSGHDAMAGDFVTFSGASAFNNVTMNGEFEITRVIGASSYEVTANTTASGTGSGGGSAVLAQYQINTGPEFEVPQVGWGAGPWGSGTWGYGTPGTDSLRLWSQDNYGQNLVFGPRGGGIYYWDSSTGTLVNGNTTRAVALSTVSGASSVPLMQNFLMVSDISRFLIVFGSNDYGETTQNPMLVRWSDQDNITEWAPAVTNQAGSQVLSTGSEIVTAIQTRQEIVVFTDSALYSMQFIGAPLVWSFQSLGDNISIVSQNCVALASGVVYWMGVDKFYVYDGRVNTLSCDLRQYIFSDINREQYEQVFAGTNEGFNEVWWFYCSADSTALDKYVVYNYLEKVWYYGTMSRSAWLDSGIQDYPIAATYDNNVVFHENGVDDGTFGVNGLLPIDAYITSSEFDIDDGHNFGFVWRILPDLTFRNSTASSPTATMYLLPLTNSGSGYNDPASVAGSDNAAVTRTAVIPVEQFTGQVYTRVRGRQMAFKIESTTLGTQWQLGAPRIDIKPDGRAGGR